MRSERVQAIVGTALTDAKFCAAILGDARRGALEPFALRADELEAIVAIRANSLEDFAGELHHLVLAARGEREFRAPPIMQVRLRRQEIAAAEENELPLQAMPFEPPRWELELASQMAS